ncbi:hypothetical protein S7711_00955 [Stachybotrys chartarum IBT 7711]|uniref:Tyrosine--tRNA ligase n=1 Tax=Stachybotrys chartarum (strain CBS 109288 / IBT 7711) TaxID=1280523 RepID=A0A084B0Q4_STACB|nr:hypothetical protein S7711_00955 [Stachybotrys chartarum IBT 7711]KFA51040.1 hypothetical protein S40293_07927 [Stachybotrys chartarum IBT 40293]KFA78657.1 hypothetical protein S40288_06957 [Stachybotrys chartarum IBT 40288]
MAARPQSSVVAAARACALSRHTATRVSLRGRQPWQARSIATTFLNKKAEGEERWAIRAEKIRNGEIRHVWDILEERGYIKDVAGKPDQIKEIMRIKRIGAYVGIDPTADSLHVGHLLPMMPLFWMWFHGHPAALLIGGATARIGDPTGRLHSREVMSNGEIGKNITKLHYQLKRIWANVHKLKEKYGYEEDWAATHRLLNNSMWLQSLTMYEFLKRLARDTRIGPMLSRDTQESRVKRKMTDGDGMSLGEFLYPAFQGWDFWYLYSKMGIQMQIGGSDQYGNIVAGCEALKTIRHSEEAPHARLPTTWEHEPLGFTVPLLTDSSGAKFGKSAGNAVWLDEFKTPAFDLYGYFMRRSDDEVERMLKLFTFMPMDKIKDLMAEHAKDPSKRVAQHQLAFDVVSLVLGSQQALEEAQQHSFRFGGDMPKIDKVPTPESGIITPNNAPRSDITLPRSVMQFSPAKLLYAAGIVSSGAEGQRLVVAQGAYVAGAPGQKKGLVPGNLSWTPMQMWFPGEANKFLIDDKYLILRKGKHNVRIIELVSDEEWKESGKVYPGEAYTGKVRMIREAIMKRNAEQGLEMGGKELNKMVRMAAEQQERLTAGPNGEIELPTKDEVRQRKSSHSKRPPSW